MTDSMRMRGVPGNETERKETTARAAAVDALWRARNAETVYGFGSAEHRAAVAVFTELSRYAYNLANGGEQ